MREITVGPGIGDARNFDAAMRQAYTEPTRVLLEDGIYKTAMLSEWNRNRPDRGFVLNGTLEAAGSAKPTIMADGDAIMDADITDEPQRIITGRGVWDDPTNGVEPPTNAEAHWNRIARDQLLRNVRLVGKHSVLVPRWRAAGKPLRTSGFLLLGHNAKADGVELEDFGAWRVDPAVGAESFPGSIVGATAAGDTVAIAQLDPATHQFEPGEITNCRFTGYVPSASNDQVTVFMIVGSFGEANGWTQGGWQFTWRKAAYHRNNYVEASGSNLVQCHTSYLALTGDVTGNRSKGADRGYYGDYLQTRGQSIELNDWQGCRHGISLLLSPTPLPLAEQFFHEDYTLGLNSIGSSGANVLIRTMEPEYLAEAKRLGLSPMTTQRYVRKIRIDRSLTVQNEGGEIEWTGAELASKGGCARLLPWRR